jgi:hypothetical protein
MDNSNKPSLRAYIGATGSGKGVSVREYLKKEKAARLVIWDPLREYASFGRTVTNIPELCKALASQKFNVCYWPGPDEKTYPEKFDLFCRAVFSAGNCTVHIEELAQVTTPSHAPPAWRRITKQGRHQGLRVIAATQRPVDCDKDFLSGVTYVRVFYLRWTRDKKLMAELLEAPLADVSALATVEKEDGSTHIQYMERDFRAGTRDKKTIVLKRKS